MLNIVVSAEDRYRTQECIWSWMKDQLDYQRGANYWQPAQSGAPDGRTRFKYVPDAALPSLTRCGIRVEIE